MIIHTVWICIVQIQAVSRVGVGEYSDPLSIVGKNTTCDTARVGDGEYSGKNSSDIAWSIVQ